MNRETRAGLFDLKRNRWRGGGALEEETEAAAVGGYHRPSGGP